MMDLVMETMIAMKNMHHENQMLTKRMLDLTKDKLNISNIFEKSGQKRLKNANHVSPTRPKVEADMKEVTWKIFLDD